MQTTYRPGNIIHQEEPFVKIIYYSERNKYCDFCFLGASNSSCAKKSKLLVCETCGYVGYCRKECQVSAQKQHKLECRHLKKLPEERRDFIRFVGLTLLSVQGKDWNSIKEPIGELNRSFGDLISNCDITKNDPKLHLHGLEMVTLVKEYLGKANSYNDDQLLEIVGKVKHNRFDVFRKGCALYIGSSIFDHACIPSATRWFEGAVVIVRPTCVFTPRSIKEVTISYARMVGMENSFAENGKTFYGKCTCWECRLPYGNSILTCILDWTRAFDVIECTELALEKVVDLWKMGVRRLDREQLETLTTLLEMQKNVLGDTNILRMRLLMAKAYFEFDYDVKVNQLIQLGRYMEAAFGPYTEEFLFMYDDVYAIFSRLTTHKDLIPIITYMNNLRVLLRGD